MNIRLNKLDAIKALQVYAQGNVEPVRDIKIRMRCAIEAIILFGKTLYHAISYELETSNQKHKSLRDVYGEQCTLLAQAVIEPEKFLPEYIATFPAEGATKVVNAIREVVKPFGLTF